jgi:hypothetical protein
MSKTSQDSNNSPGQKKSHLLQFIADVTRGLPDNYRLKSARYHFQGMTAIFLDHTTGELFTLNISSKLADEVCEDDPQIFG